MIRMDADRNEDGHYILWLETINRYAEAIRAKLERLAESITKTFLDDNIKSKSFYHKTLIQKQQHH